MSVGGTSNVLVVTSTGANIAGTLNTTGNANVFGNLGTSGSLTVAGNTGVTGNISTSGTLSVTGNANVGNINATTDIRVGNSLWVRTTAANATGYGLYATGGVAFDSGVAGFGKLQIGGGSGELTYIEGVTSGNLNTLGNLAIIASTITFSTGTFGGGSSGLRMSIAPTGAVTVNGAFSAASKSFLIDHPTKPGMKLRYGSLEGPENGVYVRGTLNGNVIELPDYWTGLIDPNSITVTLTPIGKYQKLYVEDIQNNKVYVVNDDITDSTVNCFYVVYGERIDVEKLIVEF